MTCRVLFVVSLHKVVEVREGQRTTMFDKFPYEQVENQSFSLVYLHEGSYIIACIVILALSVKFCTLCRQAVCISHIIGSHL